MTDIVLTTHNRLECLQRTLAHIYERTRSSYRIHVVNDGGYGSTWLIDEWQAGRISSVMLKSQRNGAAAALNVGTWMTFSDPVVFTDDDVLCPDVHPDWLARGLVEMKKRKRLAMLALHHPGAKYKRVAQDGMVTLCQSVGGTFLFARRAFLLEHPLPHLRNGFDVWPMEWRCKAARENDWDIGYLTETYCYHFGHESVLKGGEYRGKFVEPKDWDTLEPRRRFTS